LIEIFCQHYAMHGNATAAFIAANPRAANWKRRSAGRKPIELMKRPDVQARIAVLDGLVREQLDAARAIAKSVAKWTWSRFSPEKFSELQRYRARTRTRNHLAAIQELKHGRQGSHPTPDVGSPPGCSAEHVST
jgi:hypothetical protein